MSYLPITVFAVLAWSLLYALIFAPTLGIVLARRRGNRKKLPEDHQSEESAKTLFKPLLDFYLKLLRPVIRAPVATAVIVISVVVSVFFLYGKFGSGQEFFADIENQYGMAEVRAQGNLSIEEQLDITMKVQEIIASVEGVNKLYGYSAGGGMMVFGSDVSRDKISSFLVELHPRDQRERGSLDVFREIREKTNSLSGIYVSAGEMQSGPPTGKDIQIQISSSDRLACLLYTSPSPRD